MAGSKGELSVLVSHIPLSAIAFLSTIALATVEAKEDVVSDERVVKKIVFEISNLKHGV